MDLGGLPVTVLDTAGLRDTDDIVEGMGVVRAKERAAQADLRVYLVGKGETIGIALSDGDIVLQAKADLLDDPSQGISGTTGLGVDELVTHISNVLGQRAASVGIAMRERHRLAMQGSLGYLRSAMMAMNNAGFDDLIAEDIRTAIRSIDSLVGRIDVEDVLGEIFSSFCIGK